MGYFCKRICHRDLSKAAESGHTVGERLYLSARIGLFLFFASEEAEEAKVLSKMMIYSVKTMFLLWQQITAKVNKRNNPMISFG